MKLKLSIIFSAVLLLLSCQRDEEETQAIDQVLKLYMQNAAGQDLLNARIPGSYTSVSLLDILGERDLIPISGFSLLKDADTLTYMDYPAGAIRLKADSVSTADREIYYSKFVISLQKTVNSALVRDDDTIQVEYMSTPSLFQISKLWYNDELKFTKIPGKPNIVTIVK